MPTVHQGTAEEIRQRAPGGLVAGKREFALFGFVFHERGLTPIPGYTPTYDEWESAGDFLNYVEGGLQWWIGDYVAYGEAHFSEKSAQVVDATGWQLETIQQCARVAKQVPPARRDPDLSWSHHREVADLKPAEQQKALAHAKREDLSVAELRSHLRKEGTTKAAVWLVVSCKDEHDREKLKKRLEQEGRACKLP